MVLCQLQDIVYATAARSSSTIDLLDVVVEVGELGEERRQALSVGFPAAGALAEPGRVLVVEVVGDARRDAGGVVGVECGEVAGDGLAPSRHSAVPHSSWIVAYTFWFHENSITLPSGSRAAQM